MFKCEITYVEDINGTFVTQTTIGLSRSPKQAVAIAENRFGYRQRAIHRYCGPKELEGLGGTPTIRHFRLTQGTRVIKDIWD